MVQTSPHWFKLVKTSSNFSKLVKTSQNWFKLVLNGSNLFSDGVPNEWTDYGPCDKICQGDVGERVRRRFCNNPEPSCGGRTCERKIFFQHL